jgi:outer membrane lipoprotein-sorting protein
MKKLIVLLSALLAAALSLNAAGMSEQAKAVLAKIEKANESLTTITSPVTETRTMPNGKSFVSNGSFYFTSPNLLAISYSNPAGDYLIINTEQISQKRKQGKTFKLSLQKNETMRELSNTLLWCISGKLIKLAESNNADVKTSELNGVINVVFTAEVKSGRDFKKIELNYDKSTMRLKSMAMTDKNNVVTKYTMDKPQYGSAIDASVFIIK